MTAWQLLAGVVVAALILGVGYWLGQAQSSCALSAAQALSAAINLTSSELTKASGLARSIELCLSATSRSEQTLLRLSERVEGMDETQGQLLSAFVQRGLVRVIDPMSGTQAGEPSQRSQSRPPPMPRDSIKEV